MQKRLLLWLALLLVGCGSQAVVTETVATPLAATATATTAPPTATTAVEVSATSPPPTATTAAPSTFNPSSRLLAEPIVVSGQSLSPLFGADPQRVVAYRFNGDWQPIAVQVDERVELDLGVARDRPQSANATALFYADAEGSAGADPDGTLDGDDEVVFMSDQAGGSADLATLPGGVRAESMVVLTLSDALQPAWRGFVYLFEQTQAVTPSPAVQYTFQPMTEGGNGNKDKKKVQAPSAVEDTLVVADGYSMHYADEWVADAMVINGVDLLDRHKTRITLDFCGRSEETFSAGANFIANKSGPVRALRSVMGANSGTYTQRDTFFYPNRQEIITYLRVHPLDSLIDYFDYSADALGMRYANNLAPDGVTIDGQPDALPNGTLQWELLTGAAGSFVMVHAVDSDIADLVNDNIFIDAATPPFAPCTGDDHAYGASGPRLAPLPCTDPTECQNSVNYLTYRRVVLYPKTATDVAMASMIDAEVRSPFAVEGDS